MSGRGPRKVARRAATFFLFHRRAAASLSQRARHARALRGPPRTRDAVDETTPGLGARRRRRFASPRGRPEGRGEREGAVRAVESVAVL